MYQKITLSLVLIFISVNFAFSQTCPTGSVVLTTQEEIDSFPLKYPGCQDLPFDLYIKASNADLRRLQALIQIRTVAGDVVIEGNSFVSRLDGLQNLRDIGGDFIMRTNNVIDDVDELESLRSIGGDCIIEYNANLRNLDGLERFESVGGDLKLRFNTDLTSIQGLDFLSSVGGEISIRNQNALTSLDGLDNIASSGLSSLRLENNASLSSCDVTSICNFLDANGVNTISDNATGCNSTLEVENACNNVSSTEDEFLQNNRVNIAPNPTTGLFRVTFGVSGEFNYELNNIIGKRLDSGVVEDGGTIDMSEFSKGIYLISFFSDSKKVVRRIVKE